jgi:Arc/MetJ-type ribon-helix-helix transcriptional regulator
MKPRRSECKAKSPLIPAAAARRRRIRPTSPGWTSEVVRDAIRLYQRRKAEDAARLKALRNEIAIGLAEADRGNLLTADAASVKARGRERLAATTTASEWRQVDANRTP